MIIADLEKNIIACNQNIQQQGLLIEKNDGYHLVKAMRDFQKNEVVISSKCMGSTHKSDRYSLQKQEHLHIYMDLPAIFLNHCCDANLGITDNNNNAYDFVALRKIQSGDELTFDYETAEMTVDFFKQCNCKSPLCRKTIRGFKYHGPLIRKQYGQFIANYLKTRTN